MVTNCPRQLGPGGRNIRTIVWTEVPGLRTIVFVPGASPPGRMCALASASTASFSAVSVLALCTLCMEGGRGVWVTPAPPCKPIPTESGWFPERYRKLITACSRRENRNVLDSVCWRMRGSRDEHFINSKLRPYQSSLVPQLQQTQSKHVL